MYFISFMSSCAKISLEHNKTMKKKYVFPILNTEGTKTVPLLNQGFVMKGNWCHNVIIVLVGITGDC